MNKLLLNLNQVKDFIKRSGKLLLIDSLMVVVFCPLYCLSKDLNLFNLEKFSAFVCFVSFLFVLCELFMCILYGILQKIYDKKQKKLEIEKIIDEENKKD